MRKSAILLTLLLLLATMSFGQQSYVTKYDAYVGYAFLDSPALSLFANGMQTQVGMRWKTWMSLGFDYSISKGDMKLTPGLLPEATQAQLSGMLKQLAAAGKLPAGYQLSVPVGATSQTFAMGPQLAYRHFKTFTIFFRPSMGAIREAATPKPGDPIAALIVGQLAPHGTKTDWQGFFGFGYGMDLNFSKHVGWRIQGDLVWDHLFNDILANGRWTTRFSAGPCFNFGRNIAEHQ